MAAFKGKTVIINDRKYKLGDEIGSGGNSVVFSAHTDYSEDSYALKIFTIREKDAYYVRKKERFEKELQFCEATNHPNILKVIGHSQIEGHACYLMNRYAHTTRDN